MRETTIQPPADAARRRSWRQSLAAVRGDLIALGWIAGAFAALYWMPLGNARFDDAMRESLYLARDYAREHVLMCLVPALFIAGAISTFVQQSSVMRYLGPAAPRPLAYGVASVAGCVLAVCSCTVLPLFAGIWRMGAGLGPACAFLYAGPAINVMAILLTARVLGVELGAGRAIGAVGFSVVVGLAMAMLFRRSEQTRANLPAAAVDDAPARPGWKSAAMLLLMVAVLVLANWSFTGRFTVGIQCCPGGASTTQVYHTRLGETATTVIFADARGARHEVPRNLLSYELPTDEGLMYRLRFVWAGAATALLVIMLATWTGPDERRRWLAATWELTRQIAPLLLIGVLVAGLLLGRPGREGLIPNDWIARAVGGNSLGANAFASVAGALMYFATLTEVPIVEGLRGSGMGDGPALALLLAGPALSLPAMLVLRSVMGWARTGAYVLIVVIMATISGLIFGAIW